MKLKKNINPCEGGKGNIERKGKRKELVSYRGIDHIINNLV